YGKICLLGVRIGDDAATTYTKIKQLYQSQDFASFSFSLSDKPLHKLYDPIMEKYTEWAFSFNEDTEQGNPKNTDVRLYFNNNKLDKMQITYRTFDMPVN